MDGVMALLKGTSELRADQALLNVSVKSDLGVELWTQSKECDQCSLLYQATFEPHKNGSVAVNSTFATVFKVLQENGSREICNQQYHFGEWGRYLLEINSNGSSQKECSISVLQDPINSTLYLLWVLLGLLGACVLWTAGVVLYRRKFRNTQEDERLLVSDLGSPSERGSGSQIWSFSVEPNITRLRERLRSLDTFRGICIVLMIFVNYGGGKYWFFRHSSWNGLTVADLVFPWFMWIMGTSIALSLQSHLRRAIPKHVIFWKICKRTLILFALGLILNSRGDVENGLSYLRISGVLQRFGVTYFIVASMQLLSEKPGDVYQFERWASLRDILPYWPQWIFMSLIVGGHTAITFLLPVSGCPTGYLGPGGLHLNASQENCTGGSAGYIDRIVLGKTHLYQTPSCKVLYETSIPYDPEGILGYLTALLVVFLGLQAGKILTMYPLYRGRVTRWIIWALILGSIGIVLCMANQNEGWIPINKNLWSLSYVLTTSSMAFLLLSLCYLLVDVSSWWSGAPFFYPGMNAILLYVGHELTRYLFPWYFPVPDTHIAQLALNMWGTLLWVLISVYLYYCKFFLSV